MKLTKFFEKKYGGLVFSLLSGCAYFVIILDIVLQSAPNAGLLGFFFFPAIICGAGLVLFKSVRRLLDDEQEKKAELLCLLHVVLIVLSLVFAADLLLRR